MSGGRARSDVAAPLAPRLEPPPRALLWDIDGTLIDTTDLIVAALDHIYLTFLGRSAPRDELRALIGIPLFRQVRWFGDPAMRGANAADMEAAFISYYEERRHDERLIAPAIDALVRLRRLGLPTAVVTSKNRQEIANTLPRLGIASSVDVVVTAEDVRCPKPDPEGVLLALDRLGVPASESVFVGDTLHDLRAGRGAGVRVCAVTWGAATRDSLAAEAPDALCDHPGMLAHLLGCPAAE
ncbi:MAG TPA: HAD-IA family hydrolase [Chthonomonadales bacterium]|nr:HAD-IA family hydrolase [Chthonomonadales bacterium]